ncbi:hypothetical protein ACETK8_19785 [Brevundimonas staleyi]|uniref:Lipoprotein n=1 Tax=Brevundimonas staleyi TaxID=74326 RepID=A0ABW0FSD0_9CAUL
MRVTALAILAFVVATSACTAWSPLWRADDGECCGTAGSVEMAFEVVDDKLTLTEAEITPAP